MDKDNLDQIIISEEEEIQDFDTVRKAAMELSGLNRYDPNELAVEYYFNKMDPLTGTVVEFKGPRGEEVSYDCPHPPKNKKYYTDYEVRASHDSCHIGYSAEEEVFHHNIPHCNSGPGRSSKEIHKIARKDFWGARAKLLKQLENQ
ncbi:hypothetical protein HOD61_00875 [archaeon]|jgi:hypothetical protein|nr:hypothetical protein [archaeon]